MKVAILSDTHGYKKYMDEVKNIIQKSDLVIHAGDNFADSKYLHKIAKVDIMAVKGNCDYINTDDELVFEIEGKTIFLTHGDKYGVNYGIELIKQKAKEINADIVVFGHTHVPLYIEDEEIIFINPGSLSLPRKVKDRSLVIMDISQNNIDIQFMNFSQHL